MNLSAIIMELEQLARDLETAGPIDRERIARRITELAESLYRVAGRIRHVG